MGLVTGEPIGNDLGFDERGFLVIGKDVKYKRRAL